jgi:hypothetical protein
LVIYRELSRSKSLWLPGFIGGFVMMLSIVVVAFLPVQSLEKYAEAFDFLNSEVEYTSLLRITQKFSNVIFELGPSFAMGLGIILVSPFVVFVTNKVGISFGRGSEIIIALSGFWSVAIILGAESLLRSGCTITCDANVIAMIRISFVAVPVLAICFAHQRRWHAFEWLGVYFALAVMMTILSNAPYQYNVKYFTPAIIGAISLLSIENTRTWNRLLSVSYRFGVMMTGLLAIKVLLLSSYGSSSIWKSDTSLPGRKFAGLYGDASRRDLLLALTSTYNRWDCAKKFFVAVDSLVLPYFLFSRRPPFPHAWVATRVAASRDVISLQKEACVMMQDRVLPGTLPEARTMLDYLRLDPVRDRVQIEHVGENIYIIAFSRLDLRNSGSGF